MNMIFVGAVVGMICIAISILYMWLADVEEG